MAGLEHWLSSLPVSGAGVLWLAAGVLFAAIILALARFRKLRPSTATIWRAGLVGAAVLLVWAVLDRSNTQERAAARRALDARSAELTTRAIAPGSALPCLDAVANTAVEAACEKALFASPEAIAAAVAYVDARLTLLADGLDHAAHDRSYEPVLERLRRALEADRFGVVAHVLATRGCSADACAAFRLLRDPQRVIANLRQRTFDANVVVHAATWRSENAVAASPAEPSAPALAAASPASGPGVPVSSKYDFPSAASIPPVSIMDAEPPRPPEANAAPAATAGPPLPRPQPPQRRQSATPPPVPAAPGPPAPSEPGNSQSLR
jgi:hypothetical protein